MYLFMQREKGSMRWIADLIYVVEYSISICVFLDNMAVWAHELYRANSPKTILEIKSQV